MNSGDAAVFAPPPFYNEYIFFSVCCLSFSLCVNYFAPVDSLSSLKEQLVLFPHNLPWWQVWVRRDEHYEAEPEDRRDRGRDLQAHAAVVHTLKNGSPKIHYYMASFYVHIKDLEWLFLEPKIQSYDKFYAQRMYKHKKNYFCGDWEVYFLRLKRPKRYFLK